MDEGISLAPFVALSMYSVRRMLRLANVGSNDIVYDLGSGDGRVVITAVLEFDAKKAVGIELRKDLIRLAHAQIQKLNLARRVEIIQGNALETPVGDADVITLYLSTKGNEMLRSKLERELKPGSRVISLDYKMSRWRPSKVEGLWREIYLYQR
ncbi:MAG: methyltransferase domain-containing protein [Candidatus Bathyarchaeota archaeon]|nr:methyltransferase domain-containing protein [Candidatus Bathyarchaeota archaeon]